MGDFLLPDLSLAPWLIAGSFYLVGAALFVIRIPERLVPVKFDLVGSSHQIFHIFVVVGCSITFADSYHLYNSRKNLVCPIDLP